MVIEAEDSFVKLITKCDEGLLSQYAVYDFSLQAAAEAKVNKNNLSATVTKLKNLFYYWQSGDYERFIDELEKTLETVNYPGGGGGW